MTHTTVTSFDPDGEAACELLNKPTVKGGRGLAAGHVTSPNPRALIGYLVIFETGWYANELLSSSNGGILGKKES